MSRFTNTSKGKNSRCAAMAALALAAAAALGSVQSADAGIAVAGDLLVNLDAQSLSAGNLTTWANMGTLGGVFTQNVGGAGAISVGNVGGCTAVTLNGAGAMLGPDADLVSGNLSRSVELWAYNPALAGEETMFGWGYRANSQNMGLNFGNAGGYGAFTGYGNDLGWGTLPTASTWHHIVYTYDPAGGTNNFKVYVDGGLNNQGTKTLNTYATNNFLLGGQFGNNAEGGIGFLFSGSLAQIRVETGVLSAADIQANFYAGITATLGVAISSVNSDDWNLNTTWTPAHVPASGDDVTVNGHGITIGTAPATAATLKILSGGSVTVQSGQSLTIAGASPAAIDASGGSLLVNSGGTLNTKNLNSSAFAGVTLASGSNLGVATQLNINSDFNLSGVNTTFSTGAALSLASNTLTKTDGLTVPVLLAKGGAVAIGGTGLTVTSSMTVTGDFNTAGASSFDASTAAISLKGGLLTLGHDLTAPTLTVDGGGIAMNGKNVTLTTGLTMVNGALNTADAATFTTTSAAVTLNGGTLTLGHALAATSLTLNTGGNLLPSGQNISLADLTINKALDMGAGALSASNSITATNATLTVSNAVVTPTLNLTNSNVAGAGSVQASTYNFKNLSSNTAWGGGSSQMNIGGDGNTVVLTGVNTYGGPTVVASGALQAADGTGLPSASNLQLSGGVFQSSGTFVRSLGASPGQVQWIGDGGFAAKGGALTVTMAGTPAPLVWASTPNFVANTLVFGSTTADSEVALTHDIDLNGASRTVNVLDNASTSGDFATLSGVMSNGGIIKTGAGTLKLPAANTYAGTTAVNGGFLEAADGVGLPATSYLDLNGGAWETSGAIARTLGTGAGQVRWNAGGFSARGGDLVVNIPSAPSTLIWASTPNFLTGDMVLNSPRSTGKVDIQHSIDMNNATRNIIVNDNPASASDYAVISGNVSNGTVYKGGAGKLVMNTSGNSLKGIRVNNGYLDMGSTSLSGGVDMYVGRDNGAKAVLKMDNAFVTVNSLRFGGGDRTGVNGALYQNAGSIYVSNGGYDATPIGRGVGSYGYYEISGGGTLSTPEMHIGSDGNGLLTVTDGTVSIREWFVFGRGFGQSTTLAGVATFDGPSARLDISAMTAAFEIGGHDGQKGQFALNFSNGATQYAGAKAKEVYMGGTKGALNIASGASVQFRNVASGAGQAAVNFNGGIAKAVQAEGDFIRGNVEVYSYGAGAGFDTNGVDITLQKPILAPTNSGLSAIALANGGSGYIGEPFVDITGGSGKGATARALFNKTTGQVTGIVITNPGTGYLPGETLTATLVGGGGTGASAGAVTLAANVSGGLTKLGLGTLTLTPANTFGGETRIVAGALQINNANGLQNSTLNLDAADAGSLILNVANPVLGGLKGSRALDMGGRTVTIGNNGANTSYSGDLSNGALIKVGSGTTTLSGVNSYGATTVNAGTLKLNSGLAGPLTVNTGGTAEAVANLGTAVPVTVAAGATFKVGGTQTLLTPSFDPTSTVILSADSVLLTMQDSTAPGAINPATLTNVWNMVRSGYNGPTGAWSGTGITTTAVTNTSLNGLGLVLTGDPTLVAQTLTVREMILGDVNGDNKVTIGDVMVALNSANYQQDGTWLNGDVNYDGKVTIGDVMLMLNSTRYQQDYNPANAPAQIAALEAAGLGSLASAAVPEPATLGLLAVGAMGFLARRRRS